MNWHTRVIYFFMSIKSVFNWRHWYQIYFSLFHVLSKYQNSQNKFNSTYNYMNIRLYIYTCYFSILKSGMWQKRLREVRFCRTTNSYFLNAQNHKSFVFYYNAVSHNIRDDVYNLQPLLLVAVNHFPCCHSSVAKWCFHNTLIWIIWLDV